MKKIILFAMLVLCSTFSYSQEDTTILPIVIVNFQYDSFEEELSWGVESQVNFSHFEVERSVNSIEDWVTLGETFESPYEVSLENGINYFRMRMVDLDGTFEFSDIVTGAKGQDATVEEAIKFGQYFDINGQVTTRRDGLLLIRFKNITHKLYIKQ